MLFLWVLSEKRNTALFRIWTQIVDLIYSKDNDYAIHDWDVLLDIFWNIKIFHLNFLWNSELINFQSD